ncbi:MAG: hypothetical protein A2504_17635 [Bdellovibrionales bacterium RIFOXYD12_FULL_39_22]|nr:MAG: hypothetical protein A2385_15335 [Bdellovibrionales bacterium RIFOXYB1_FULL_39_21]OFZ40618.1 MAG: hypothetical protein A2485_03430 [Bdellovibrionales bacterium RIFOXYC12_FULL_39_17]OFZ50434.1 MAG: hypothetical protein A2404_02635 [Bdellovibrionales bacterium RIFOXYC1_FULL_39_130]OFZ75285.1 MAG: hypothetical protein A2451_12875 [Bdellovibrionales bacterium RIFOXYC2_FULL_39_8]OFZ77693.1 MAG: hypothetical protein A2560_05005 [Bdellovibrionales bacterium RIFOXYD1_FULL_39_84]OFZ91727.1 MAG:
MIKFFIDGGPFMYVIALLSILAFAMVLEKYFALTFSYPFRRNFFGKVVKSVRERNISGAAKMCRSTGHPLAAVISEILRNYDQSMETIESASGLCIQKLIPKIQKRTYLIQVTGNISMLFGLLGTIQGLITSFSSLSGADAATKAEILANGISTAMNTTAFGLIVAIPCIVAYAMLANKESSILQKYDETINEILHIIEHEHADRSSSRSKAA